MSGITSIVINGVEVVTSDRELVLSLLTPTAQPLAPAQSAAQETALKVSSQRRKSAKPKGSPKVKSPKVSTPKAEILAEVRRLYRDGDFDAARALIPSGWAQVHTEVNNAAQRWMESNADLVDEVAASAQEPKATGKPKRQSKPKASKPKSTKPKASKTVPTGTEGDSVSRVTPKEDKSLNDWKNLYTGKVNDLLAGGCADEIALGYAELVTLIEALDVEADKVDPKDSGKLIAKACHLADLVGRLSDFVAA